MPPLNEPILIDTQELLLHPFGASEMKRFETLSLDILQLLSQQQTTAFLPHKRLKHIHHAETLLQTGLLNQYSGMSQLYFITQKSTKKTIGMIELISPNGARNYYKLKQYPYFIEFCLSTEHTGQGIMSSLLPKLIKQLNAKGIHQLGAVVHPKNLSAIKVLKKSGIDKMANFDHQSNLYHN
ncbi:GNAT family N-acetyltransferase [Pedobacter ureilyticus]|uniref:GNAT family N-acetyltransferase n=1 Tax=Pedobacter ureilyticus TaxID=1393051 RepID=A0ABW9J2F2_9SPHI|nr:GNAT family N-acetyltransferase [Pedobacter helvus]